MPATPTPLPDTARHNSTNNTNKEQQLAAAQAELCELRDRLAATEADLDSARAELDIVRPLLVVVFFFCVLFNSIDF